MKIKLCLCPFSINKTLTNNNDNSITVHKCFNKKFCNIHTCKIINEVSRIRYLGILFDKNLK
jgi:hypothetical protein